MQTLEAINTRRSTRKYKADEVPMELLEQVIEAGRMAPSGGNSQSTHFIVVTDRKVLDELILLVRKSFKKMKVRPGMYKSLVNSIVQSKAGRYIFDYNAPVLIITANKVDYGNNIADCACALENMMIAANELDLGSCWINQLRWLNEDKKVTKFLENIGLEKDEKVYGALALGFPDTKDGLPVRKPLKRTGNKVTYVK